MNTCHCGREATFAVEVADDSDMDTDEKTTAHRVCAEHLGAEIDACGDRVVVVWRANAIGAALWSARWLEQQGWRQRP